MLSGLAAIIILIKVDVHSKEIIALLLILFGGFADLFDGYLARKFNAVTAIGKQLDSFADLVTFGIAPVCLLHYLVSCGNKLVIIVSFLFTVAGAYRLARYNINDFNGHFMGLPITAAGIILALYAVFYARCNSHQYPTIMTVITIIFIATLSIAMISKIKVKRILTVRNNNPKGL